MKMSQPFHQAFTPFDVRNSYDFDESAYTFNISITMKLILVFYLTRIALLASAAADEGWVVGHEVWDLEDGTYVVDSDSPGSDPKIRRFGEASLESLGSNIPRKPRRSDARRGPYNRIRHSRGYALTNEAFEEASDQLDDWRDVAGYWPEMSEDEQQELIYDYEAARKTKENGVRTDENEYEKSEDYYEAEEDKDDEMHSKSVKTSGLEKRNNYYDLDRFAQNPRNEGVFKGMSKPRPPLKQDEVAGVERIPFTFYMFDCNFASPRFPLEPYMEAREGLLRYCDKWGVPASTRHLAFSKVGDVVVYVCNTHRKKVNFCHRNEWRWIEENVFDRRCGQLTSAFVKSAFSDRTYGRAWKGERVCLKDTVNSASWTGTPDSIARDAPSPDAQAHKYLDWIDWEPYVEIDQAHNAALNSTIGDPPEDDSLEDPNHRPHKDHLPVKNPEYFKPVLPRPLPSLPRPYPWDLQNASRIRNGTQKGGTNSFKDTNSTSPLLRPVRLPVRPHPNPPTISEKQVDEVPEG